MGLAAATWVPMGAPQVAILPPNDHPNPSQPPAPSSTQTWQLFMAATGQGTQPTTKNWSFERCQFQNLAFPNTDTKDNRFPQHEA